MVTPLRRPRRARCRTRCGTRCGGYTLIEVACAFAVLSVLATTVFIGEGHSVKTVARSFRETAALHLSAGRLEQLAAPGSVLEPGKSRFEVDERSTKLLPHPRAYQVVRQTAPGLFEVTAEVSWLDPGQPQRIRVQLTTLIAQEATR